MDGDTDLAMIELVDVLKRRQIKTVRYFHADHFEPWSLGVNERTARGVERMRSMSRASPFARKLSLFYCPYVPYALDLGLQKDPAGRASEGDAVHFGHRSVEQEQLAREAIRPLAMADGHEMHLHVHHEFWTRNESAFDTAVSRWVNASSTADMDSRRLDFGFARFTEIIARELGTAFDRWAFVHGNWALAASDPLICTVENELGLIMRHGGFGDFSFPAGRGYCDPALPAPFTCLPIEGKRAYDDPAADPRLVEAGSGAMRPERFFIWNSPIKAAFSSLDYYSESNRRLFKEPDRIISEWLRNSVCLDGTLFIKTHAHSMKWEYKIHEPDALIPHCHPDIVAIFERLRRVCDRAAIDFQCVTVNEVMAWLRTFDAAGTANVSARPDTIAGEATTEPAGVLERDIVRRLHGWLHEEPQRLARSGAFYHHLLQQDRILQDYERAVLDHIAARFPPDRTRIVEVGVGYGVLSLHLAALGYEVIAFEGDPQRFAGLQFLAGSPAGGGLTPVHGWFPDALDRSVLRPDRRNVLVMTNIVASAAAKRQAAMLDAAQAFDDVIIDMTRFGVLRYEREAAALFQAEVAARFAAGAPVWRNEPNEIWHFRAVMADNARVVEEQVATPPRPPSPASISEGSSVAMDLTAFNAEMLALHRDWMAAPEAVQGDDLYASKVSRQTALEAYETAVAEAIVDRIEAGATIVEIGSGYGALAMLLAQRGFVVHGFEGDRRRHTACAWHLERYLARHPQLVGRVDCTNGFFPDVLPVPTTTKPAKRIGLATNVTCTYTATHHSEILDALRGFDEVIIDLSRFGKVRNTQQERDALREAMIGLHFEPIEQLYVSEPYEYWRFRVRRPVVAVPNATTARDAVFPLRGQSGVLYSTFGDRHLDECPVCHGRDTVGLWRMPMANLKEPISLFGGYFNQVPTLQVPGTVYCFDFCRDCESVFLNPVPKSQKDSYRKSEHYLRMMQDEAQWRGYEDAFKRFEKWIPPDATVLMDAACGIGQYLEVARRRMPDRWRRMIGLELSEKYVEHMRTKGYEAHAFDIDNDALEPLVKPGSVDFITFCEAFEHVERPLDALTKLLVALRPGGRLYFTAQRYGTDVQAAVRPGEPIYIGEKVMRELPQRLGCKVIDVTTSSMRYYTILEK